MSDKQPLIINPENFDPITKEQESLRSRRDRLRMQARVEAEKERDHEFEEEPKKEENTPKVEQFQSRPQKRDKWMDYAKTATEFTGTGALLL